MQQHFATTKIYSVARCRSTFLQHFATCNNKQKEVEKMDTLNIIKETLSRDADIFFPSMQFQSYAQGWRSRHHLDGNEDGKRQFVSFLYHGKTSVVDHARGECVGVIDLYTSLGGFSSFADAVKDLKQRLHLSDEVTSIHPIRTSQQHVRPQQHVSIEQRKQFYNDNETARKEAFASMKRDTPLHAFIRSLCLDADTTQAEQHTEPRAWTRRAEQAINAYCLGGEVLKGLNYTAFWYVDSKREIQSLKLCFYQQDGKRDRDPQRHIVSRNSVSCLYGEHLLNAERYPLNKDKTVVIVESEKTAILLSLLLSDCVVLATGGANNFRRALQRECLKGRIVVAIADADKVDEWRQDIAQAGATASLLNDIKTDNSILRHITGKEDIGDGVVSYLQQLARREQTPLQALIDKNPAILDLIREFDLVIDENPQTVKYALKAVETRPQYARR